MKFLCVNCDEQMKIQETRGPDEGSMTVIFQCPGCGWEVGMLTNPYETQIVHSLNVKIGSKTSESSSTADTVQPEGSTAAIKWTPAAEKRLQRVPPFVRKMARMGVEQFARENEHEVISEEVMAAARNKIGM